MISDEFHGWLFQCCDILSTIILPLCGCRYIFGISHFNLLTQIHRFHSELECFLLMEDEWKYLLFIIINVRIPMFRLSLKNDGICEIMYNTKWYALPIKMQKDLMHLINRRQNRTTLAIGPFAELNIETFFIVGNIKPSIFNKCSVNRSHVLFSRYQRRSTHSLCFYWTFPSKCWTKWHHIWNAQHWTALHQSNSFK